MTSLEELRRKIAELRKNRSFQTNIFLSPDQLDKIVSAPETLVSIDGSLVCILEKERGFYRLHYCASTPEDMTEGLKLFLTKTSVGPVVADIVNRPQTVELSVSCLEQLGFRYVEKLTRMYLKAGQSALFHDNTEVSWAVRDDAAEIEKLLYQSFNIYVSRLPSREEITDMLCGKQILVERRDRCIAGIAIFKPQKGDRVLLDQLLVRDGYRGHGVGSNLLQAGVCRFGNGNVISLWALESAVSFYKRHGFDCEERVDYILLFEGEKYGKDLFNSKRTSPGT